MQITKTIGSGPESVYVYSFPSQIRGDVWPCKIGKSKGDPIQRIKQQQASMQETPEVLLVIKTDKCQHLERSIHLRLADKHMAAYGREWFLTNDTEVESAALETTLSENIGETIRMARLSSGMTQAELARISGVRQGTLSMLESGNDVMLSTLKAVCKTLSLEIKFDHTN